MTFSVGMNNREVLHDICQHCPEQTKPGNVNNNILQAEFILCYNIDYICVFLCLPDWFVLFFDVLFCASSLMVDDKLKPQSSTCKDGYHDRRSAAATPSLALTATTYATTTFGTNARSNMNGTIHWKHIHTKQHHEFIWTPENERETGDTAIVLLLQELRGWRELFEDKAFVFNVTTPLSEHSFLFSSGRGKSGNWKITKKWNVASDVLSQNKQQDDMLCL